MLYLSRRHLEAHAQEQPGPRGAGIGAGRPPRGHVAHQRGQAQDRGPAADVRHLQRHRPVPGNHCQTVCPSVSFFM